MQSLIIPVIDYSDVYNIDLNLDLLNKLDSCMQLPPCFHFSTHHPYSTTLFHISDTTMYP